MRLYCGPFEELPKNGRLPAQAYPTPAVKKKIGDVGENATYQTYLGQVLKQKKCGRMICFFIVKGFVDEETAKREFEG